MSRFSALAIVCLAGLLLTVHAQVRTQGPLRDDLPGARSYEIVVTGATADQKLAELGFGGEILASCAAELLGVGCHAELWQGGEPGQSQCRYGSDNKRQSSFHVTCFLSNEDLLQPLVATRHETSYFRLPKPYFF